MNRKGLEFGMIGSLVVLAVAIIVVMSLMPQISTNIAATTKTNTVVNQSANFPNSSATVNYVALQGQAVSSVTVKNTSGDVTVPASNYTIQNYILGTDGTLSSRLVANDLTYLGYPVKISYVSEPYGYDTNAGGRGVTNLILILASLAVAVVVITYVIRNDIFNF